ncbi:zinc-binding dehydrogenase [Leifsonia xyli subsp. cynodontis DSM 46306]|uniref:Enoyl reductase (ER) domain-containing protein n=1 Tax=Leifsonia xyli subsp. cynodontis DSM 46306 TaxID=1389489 RepID=U3P995_LEIXC|nr:zinc-binding dehydrogenase [Leifsonia xyli]AGW42381.1 zinc-binding dehydrogenase [Leifsonia xyli subsp. cynodontis DSM 46306]
MDAVTAALALRAAGPAPRILVQGATGAVGALAVQFALREGRMVVGTASRTDSSAIPIVDYRAEGWPAAVRAAAGGAVDAAIDHTGSVRAGEALAAEGVLVHTAWAGRPGHERADALRGAVDALRKRRERVVSVPAFVRFADVHYRRLLAGLLADAAEGRLRAPEPVQYPFDELWSAYRTAARREPGRKTVLRMPGAAE